MKRQLFILIAVMLGLMASAQNITVKGRVMSKTDGEPLMALR